MAHIRTVGDEWPSAQKGLAKPLSGTSGMGWLIIGRSARKAWRQLKMLYLPELSEAIDTVKHD